MHQIKMSAGALSVDIQAGDDADPAELAEICKGLQEWQMRQWTEIDGACVSTKPQSFNLFG